MKPIYLSSNERTNKRVDPQLHYTYSTKIIMTFSTLMSAFFTLPVFKIYVQLGIVNLYSSLYRTDEELFFSFKRNSEALVYKNPAATAVKIFDELPKLQYEP